MKLNILTGFQRTIYTATAISALAFAGFNVTAANENIPPPAQTSVAASPLSHPAQEVVKMTTAGVSEGVVKAYVDNAPSMFKLTADQIIHLQALGVPQSVITEMFTRDGVLRDNNLANAAAVATQPPTDMTAQPAPYPPDSASYAAPVDQPYYNDLASYGDWNYVPDYGWGWQPSVGLAYADYPWGFLGAGFWCTVPNFGLCWFPNGGFNRFNRFGSFARFNHFRDRDDFNRFGAFRGSRFSAGFRPSMNTRAFGGFRANRSFATRSFNPGMSRFGGGRIGGAHFSGGGARFGGGSHFSGGGGHFSGGSRGGGGNGHR